MIFSYNQLYFDLRGEGYSHKESMDKAHNIMVAFRQIKTDK